MTRQAWPAVHLALVLCLLGGLGRAAYGRDVPDLEHRVTDLAHLLSQQEKDNLEERLKSYEGQTGRQFALLTVPSLDGEPLEVYSIRVVERWKLGRKGQDDGLLMLVAAEEHRLRIEVGYRLEPTLTDALCSQVERDILKPAFRAAAYSDGVIRAFDVLMAAANKDPVQGLLRQEPDTGWGIVEAWLLLSVFFIYAIVVFIFSFVSPQPHQMQGGPTDQPRRSIWFDDSGGGWGGGGFSGGSGSGFGGGGSDFGGGGGGFGGGGASGGW